MQFAALGDVPQRIAACVAVLGGIGHLADADTVENDPDDAAETHCLVAESPRSD